MLLRFSVKNFLSFRKEAIMSLYPTKDIEHPENIISKGNYKGLNTIATFGANAAGKTSFFKALTSMIVIVKYSNNRQVNELLPIIPFKFNENTIDEPSEFEIQFVASDGKKYVYGFSADKYRIHKEYLFRYGSRKPTKVFERNDNNEYEFTAREKSLLLPLTKMNTPNKLFLATATMWNSQSTRPAFEWLASSIDTYTDLVALTQESIRSYQSASSKDYISFTEKLMKETDINISKIDVKVKKKEIDSKLLPFIPGIVVNGQLIQPKGQVEMEINTFHSVRNEMNETREYSLTLDEESQGTKVLFSFSPLLKMAFEKGKTVVIDEMDSSLHPLVVKYIVNLFRNPELNKNGAQLIITTHDTKLFSLSIFRRDQLYLVEKDNRTAESAIFSLEKCSVRKDKRVESGYLLGEFGGIPSIQVGDII